MKLYIGVEIGATKQQIILMDESGKIHNSISENVDIAGGAQAILSWIKLRLPVVMASAEGSVKGIGVGFGGVVESATGRILLSVQVRGWEDIALKSWFEEQFSLPTVIANDTVCGGFCEYKLGTGKGYDVFFYTNIGSGIGGALFIEGENYDGQGFGAAYFGNSYVPGLDSAPARIESICSGWAIEQRLRTAGYVPKDSRLYEICGGNYQKLTCRDLNTAAETGDSFANAEIELVAKYFGIGLGNFMTYLHPQRVSIGGGVAHLGRKLFDPMTRYAQEYAFGPCKKGFDIVQCQYTEMAVPMGAALMAIKN